MTRYGTGAEVRSWRRVRSYAQVHLLTREGLLVRSKFKWARTVSLGRFPMDGAAGFRRPPSNTQNRNRSAQGTPTEGGPVRQVRTCAPARYFSASSVPLRELRTSSCGRFELVRQLRDFSESSCTSARAPYFLAVEASPTDGRSLFQNQRALLQTVSISLSVRPASLRTSRVCSPSRGTCAPTTGGVSDILIGDPRVGMSAERGVIELRDHAAGLGLRIGERFGVGVDRARTGSPAHRGCVQPVRSGVSWT